MKKLYFRFTLSMLLIVVCSSFVATLLAAVIGYFADFERGVIAAMSLRFTLTPPLTIASAAIVIPLISKRAAAPITALSEAAKEIAKGDLDVRVRESGRKDEIGALERDFNLMVKELKSNEFMRKDFVANISHEFKTPLSIIQGYASLLAEDEVSDDERRRSALTIKNESARLIGLSSNILRLSRLNAQAIKTNRTRFMLDEQIRQAVLLLQPQWGSRDIRFDMALYEQRFTGDEELLSQVWLNVIENAVKFSNDGAVIHIRLKKTGREICVEIADGGVGMDEATKARMFEQFYQGDTSRANEGSGLGLAIVKRIVELHGGEIRVESVPDEGTSFFVLLPQSADEA